MFMKGKIKKKRSLLNFEIQQISEIQANPSPLHAREECGCHTQQDNVKSVVPTVSYIAFV